jgi:integrase
MGLGSANSGDPAAVTLAEARERAADARKQIAAGLDPLETKRATKVASTVPTFGNFADAYIKDQRASWSNPKHAAQWSMTLGDAYCGCLRKKRIDEIGVQDVLEVLSPIWLEKTETARRIRMRLEKVLDAARVLGFRSGENPARLKGNLDHLLPRQTKTKGHHAALPFAEVPEFMSLLAERPSTASLAFQFLILTAGRTKEVLRARWSEIELESRRWTIPVFDPQTGERRMKADRKHRVPLSNGSIRVLEACRGGDPEWVFCGSQPGHPLSNMALLMQLRRMARDDITPHGFRSSFRDWAAECTSFPSEVVEMALAHAVANQTEAAYRRGDLFEKRRALMDEWAEYLDGAGDATTVRAERE